MFLRVIYIHSLLIDEIHVTIRVKLQRNFARAICGGVECNERVAGRKSIERKREWERVVVNDERLNKSAKTSRYRPKRESKLSKTESQVKNGPPYSGEKEKEKKKRYTSRSFHESRTSISGRLLARTIMHITQQTREIGVYTRRRIDWHVKCIHAYVDRRVYLVK